MSSLSLPCNTYPLPLYPLPFLFSITCSFFNLSFQICPPHLFTPPFPSTCISHIPSLSSLLIKSTFFLSPSLPTFFPPFSHYFSLMPLPSTPSPPLPFFATFTGPVSSSCTHMPWLSFSWQRVGWGSWTDPPPACSCVWRLMWLPWRWL